jgi:hypothetical protein
MGIKRWRVALIIHPHLVPLLGMSISAHVLPLCVFVTRYGDTVTFCWEI